MLHVPQRGRPTRLLALGCGLLVFIWLTPEDNAIWPVAVLGSGMSALAITLWLLGRIGGQAIPARYVPFGAALLGGIIGFGAVIATVMLMFFKNAVHGHIYLDFPVPVMGAMLQRIPAWTAGGVLLALGLSLAWLALSPAASQSVAQDEL